MKQIPLKWNVKINYEKLFNFNKLIITLTRFNIHPYFNTKKQIQDRFQQLQQIGLHGKNYKFQFDEGTAIDITVTGEMYNLKLSKLVLYKRVDVKYL